MASARELTAQYVDAYNRRDRTAMRELLSTTLEYVRPGGGTLRTAVEVMAQYERGWAVLERSRVVVRDLMESSDAILAEITVEGSLGGRSAAVEGVIAHRWHDGKLVRYRYYSDPMPEEVAALQPPRSGA
jgi:ketosteroid isomerase-like protein